MLSYKELKQLNHNCTLFDYITSKDVVEIAYKQTQKGSPKHKRPAVRFRMNETDNLNTIVNSVKNNQWEPKGYYKFEIFDPKHRIIFAPAYEDKIVHHMLYQVLREFYEPKFIHDSYSCIRGKGNQRAVRRLQQHYSRASSEYQEVHLVKIDIKKFFHTIPRDILKEIYAKDIKCSRTLNLIYKIIDSSPKEVGLPLGCVTSQLSANVIMNPFDQYVKRELKVKYYLRYADDVFMLLPSKALADSALSCSQDFIVSKLKMGFAKGKCFSAKIKCTSTKAISGLGYRIYPSHVLLKSLNKRRIIKAVNKYKNDSSQSNKNSLLAYKSYLSTCNSFNFEQFHFKELDIYDLLLRQ